MLYILTTATPRHELHQECCIQFVSKLVKFKDVTWIINIDVPSILNISDEYVDECISNFKKIKTFKTLIHVNKTDPSFSNAGRYLIQYNFNLFEENDLIFWLEDDWCLYEDMFDDFLSKYDEFEKSKLYNYLLLTTCKYPSGNPIIFKRIIVDKLYNVYKNNKDIDPELAIIETVHKLTGLIRPRQLNSCMRLPIFYDKGREWRNTMNIEKTKKSLKNTRWIIK